MEGKVAVIGSEDFVMPFTALGLDTFAVDPDGDKIRESAQDILEAKYSMVVVAENIARVADEVFSTTIKDSLPCVVVVPFTTEPEGFSTESLGNLLKRSIGIDIVNN